MPIEYAFGDPSLEEWHGLWKSVPDDPDVTEEEFNSTFKSLNEWISQYGENCVHEDCDFFVVGDCQGDKTQCVELVNPFVLTMSFLMFLQRWIREYNPNWRVVIPTYLSPHNVLLVYKDAIRANSEYEANVEEGLRLIREKMLSLDDYKHVRKR